ncbi:carboxypeptidase-like regulatory domain-containing protein [candidate division KSB1 bacterium]|nr:carboxypeptidase-like regulatory domain-containing protein [candidate division KSB1 bacterium]
MRTIHCCRIVVFSLLIFLAGTFGFRTEVQAQQISTSVVYGTILDATTGEPLSDVNVFLANTTIGDASAPDGSYQIAKIPTGVYTLVFRRMGYEIEIIPLEFRVAQMLEYNVKLIQRPIQGKEISVTASIPKRWKQDLKKFTKLFLGESKNSRKTRILNPYVLDFFTDEDTGEFFAASDSILKIENHALGYRLDISLDRFEYDDRTEQCVFGICASYQEMDSQNEKELKAWKANRLSTYRGSFRHFLSALARQKSHREDFYIFEIPPSQFSLVDDQTMILPGAEQKSDEEMQLSDDESDLSNIELMNSETAIGTFIPLKENAIVFFDSTSSMIKIKFEDYIAVIYKKLNIREPNNFLKLTDTYTYAEIDTFGNLLSPYAIEKFGDWANEGVADSLPLDYRPTE